MIGLVWGFKQIEEAQNNRAELPLDATTTRRISFGFKAFLAIF